MKKYLIEPNKTKKNKILFLINSIFNKIKFKIKIYLFMINIRLENNQSILINGLIKLRNKIMKNFLIQHFQQE